MSTVLDEVILEDRPEMNLSVLPSLGSAREPTTVLAIDLGTSGTRAALFNQHGELYAGSLVEASSTQYGEFVSGGDVNAEDLFNSFVGFLDRAVERAEEFVSRIDYVAASCFWHSLIGIDEAGRALTPLFGWADTRAAGAAGELREKLSEPKTHARTGCRFHPSYWPAKLLWLRQSSGEFAKVSRWISFSDYVYCSLFGTVATSVSMASATGLLEQATCDWDDQLLSDLEIRREQLPPVAALRKTAGGLRDEYMLRWPILDRAAWLQAVGDGAANNVGAGCVSRAQVALMLGTSGAIRMVSSRAAPVALPSELFCYRADRDRVVIGGALSDGGGLMHWLQQHLTPNSATGELNASLASLEPDGEGLTILPFWSGERAPGWSLAATGTIHGLTSATKPIVLMRAAMESIGYLFARISQSLDSFAPDAAITLTGKTFRAFPVWAQILADVLGRRVELSAVGEASLRGAALLALETIGTIDSLETIKSEPGRVFVPDMQRHEIYGRGSQRQQDLYRKLVN